jgi:hypothetical protein
MHAGSWPWMAPEINPFIGNNGEHNKQTDVYAFGLVRLNTANSGFFALFASLF